MIVLNPLNMTISFTQQCAVLTHEMRVWLDSAVGWFHLLSVSDRITLVGVFASTALAIVIAWVQYRQSEKMANMEIRIEQREEARHNEVVNAQAADFIIRYGANRSRIPLCAIAAMYDDTFLYSNEIYRSFCCLPREVKDRVLERCGESIRVSEIADLGQLAIDRLLEFFDEKFPNNQSPFYDNAKYVTRSIEYYPEVKYEHLIKTDTAESDFTWLQRNTRLYGAHIEDALYAVLESQEVPEEHVIDELMRVYSFQNNDLKKVCQFATTLAYWLIVYSKEQNKKVCTKGVGEVLTSDDLTLEDLFLAFLFSYVVRYIEQI